MTYVACCKISTLLKNSLSASTLECSVKKVHIFFIHEILLLHYCELVAFSKTKYGLLTLFSIAKISCIFQPKTNMG